MQGNFVVPRRDLEAFFCVVSMQRRSEVAAGEKRLHSQAEERHIGNKQRKEKKEKKRTKPHRRLACPGLPFLFLIHTFLSGLTGSVSRPSRSRNVGKVW